MKYSIACLAAIAIASSAFAVTLGTAPAVTIAFSASVETGGFKNIDPETDDEYYEDSRFTEGNPDRNGNVISTKEIKTVIKVVRVGNAEILKGLLEDGNLDGTVKGWSIVGARALDEGLGLDGIYAVKKGRPAVLIQDVDSEYEYESVITFQASVATKSGKEITSSDSPEVTKKSYTENGKAVLGLSYNGFDIQGIGTYSLKYAKGNFGKGSSAVLYEIEDLGGAVKSTGLSGTFPVGVVDEEGNEVYGIVEGSVSIAAESVLDLELLGFAYDTTQVGVQPN